MNISFIVVSSSAISTATYRIRNIGKYLGKNGHKVNIILFNIGKTNSYTKKEINGIIFDKFTIKQKISIPGLKRLFFYLQAYRLLKKFLKIKKPDIICASSPPCSVFIPVVFAADKKIPFVTDLRDIHQEWTNYHKIYKYFYEILEEFAGLFRATSIITVTDGMEKILKSSFFKNKVAMISNGIERKNIEQTEAITTNNSKISLVYISSFTSYHVSEVWIPIIHEIAKTHDVELFAVGDGIDRTIMLDAAKKYNVNKYITWTGKIEHKEVYEYIKKADFGLVSVNFKYKVLWDISVPIKFYEYIGMNKPVIGIAGESLNNMIAKTKGGICFNELNLKNIAKDIIKYKEKIIDKKIQFDYDVINDYTYKKIALRYERLFKHLIYRNEN